MNPRALPPPLLLLLPLTLLTAGALRAQRVEYEEPPHNYFSAPLSDKASPLDEEFVSKRLTLPAGDDLAAVRTVLKRLNIAESSQVLVFSKTSAQRDLISPRNPRAIWFNDEVYAAWVPGGFMEIAAVDPVLGPVFYSISFHRPDRATPRLDRPQSCMDCHGAAMTNQVPGLMMRSVYPDADGSPLFQAGTALIDQTSEFGIRWGGWYVTGGHGAARHRGNMTAVIRDGRVILDAEAGANVGSLRDFFTPGKYPREDSDIVALMVLEHQLGMTSRLVEASYAVRRAILRRRDLLRELGEPPEEDLTGTAAVVAESRAGEILKYLLFSGEPPFPAGGIRGGRDFQADFLAAHPAMNGAESLAELDLQTRLFKTRCGFLIHSRLWDALPPPFLALLYERLRTILLAEAPPPEYAHLPREERRRIFEIIRATKSGLPASWAAAGK